MNSSHYSMAQPQWIPLIYNPLTDCNKWRVETRNATPGAAPNLLFSNHSPGSSTHDSLAWFALTEPWLVLMIITLI